MTPDQFERNLLTFGADLERWPEKVRQDAETMIAARADIRGAWNRAERLDRLLRLDRESAIETTRLSSITDAALRGIRRQEPVASAWRWLFTKPVGVAFASAAFAGLFAVFLVGPIFDPPRQGVSAVTFMLGGGSHRGNELF